MGARFSPLLNRGELEAIWGHWKGRRVMYGRDRFGTVKDISLDGSRALVKREMTLRNERPYVSALLRKLVVIQ